MNNSKVRVKVIKGNIQQALKKFKNKTMDSGHLQELRDRQQFLKPSVVKRKQKKDAIRAQRWSDEKESI
jgi:small subunit ribosomal protein S21